jgi:hypothetical protein
LYLTHCSCPKKSWQAKDGEGTGNNVPAGTDVQNFQSHGYKQQKTGKVQFFSDTLSEKGSQTSEARSQQEESVNLSLLSGF